MEMETVLVIGAMALAFVLGFWVGACWARDGALEDIDRRL